MGGSRWDVGGCSGTLFGTPSLELCRAVTLGGVDRGEITVSLVRRLIAAQFPKWSDLDGSRLTSPAGTT